MTTPRARRIVLALACIVPVHRAAAQTVMPGDRVRVVDIQRRTTVLTGELIRLSGDSITIRSTGNQAVSVAGAEHFLDVSAGMQRSTWTGIGLGFLVGAVTGYVVGASAYEPCGGSFCPFYLSQGEEAGITAAAFAIPAMVIGGIIGHNFKHEVWQQVDRPPVRVGIAPAPGRGVLFSASIAF